MIITDAGRATHSMNLYTGDPLRSIQAFALFEFGIKAGQIPAEQADELFRILARVWNDKETGRMSAKEADKLFGLLCSAPPEVVTSLDRKISSEYLAKG